MRNHLKLDKIIAPIQWAGESPITSSATINAPARQPRIEVVVVMGVSGSGKTTVGIALAERLGWQFTDGDTLHPPANIAKMHAGEALDDADRAPWLAAIAAHIDAWRANGVKGIITCSALKRRYRDTIIKDEAAVRLVYLVGTPVLIAARLARRRGHFMPAALLQSQFAALEPPSPDENSITVEIDQPIAAIVEDIVTALSSPKATMTPARMMASA